MPASQSVSGSPSHPSQQELTERVSAAFETLAKSAAALNVVSDELGKPIPVIDAALQRLNLGVSAWVQFGEYDDADHDVFEEHSIGYTKVSGTWGIAIRTRHGSELNDEFDDDEEELWRFNDAPRSYRLAALDRLPELLEQLARVVNDTAGELTRKVASAKLTAKTISEMASADPASRK